MGLDFPSSPTVGQLFSTGRQQYMYRSSPNRWDNITGNRTAQPYNYVVNPAMQIAQENDTIPSTNTSWWSADQWLGVCGAATGRFNWLRVLTTTPGGSTYRLRIVCSTADTVLDFTDYAYMRQSIEGLRVGDLTWGLCSRQADHSAFRLSCLAGGHLLCGDPELSLQP